MRPSCAQAFEYERFARTQLERYFRVHDTASRWEMAAAACKVSMPNVFEPKRALSFDRFTLLPLGLSATEPARRLQSLSRYSMITPTRRAGPSPASSPTSQSPR